MRSIYRKAAKVKPVRRTRVLFDATEPRPVPHFGRGILRSVPVARRTWTDEDARWAARCFSHLDVIREARAEMEAGIAEFMDRYEAGYCTL